MTRDELVAALKARKVSESAHRDFREQVHAIARRERTDRGAVDALAFSESVLVAAQAADAERLAEALDVALYTFFEAREDGAKYIPAQEAAWGAFAASLTGPTTRETERP